MENPIWSQSYPQKVDKVILFHVISAQKYAQKRKMWITSVIALTIDNRLYLHSKKTPLTIHDKISLCEKGGLEEKTAAGRDSAKKRTIGIAYEITKTEGKYISPKGARQPLLFARGINIYQNREYLPGKRGF